MKLEPVKAAICPSMVVKYNALIAVPEPNHTVHNGNVLVVKLVYV